VARSTRFVQSRTLVYSSRRLAPAMRHVRMTLSGPVVANAMHLYAATIVTSLLGFFYWLMAAHLASPQAVGVASAVQSAALFMSVFAVFGLSTLVLSELALDRTLTRSLLLTGGLSAATAAAVAATGVALLLRVLSPELRPGLASPIDIVIFALLSALTTLLVIVDDACIGLLRGELQLRRNSIFALSKLLILPAFILFWPAKSGVEMVAAWVAGMVISLVTVLIELSSITQGQHWRFDFAHLFRRRQLMFGHYWLNLSIQSPRLIIPVMVTIIVSASSNAAFTVAMLLVGFINIMPIQLSTVLFALKPGDEVRLRLEVRKTMRLCAGIAVLAAPGYFFASGFALGLFGAHYRIATNALVILGLTVYPLAVKTHYVAIARVRSKMASASVQTLIGGALEVGLAALGGKYYGLTGVALGYLVATVCEALLFAPTVFRVLRKAPDVAVQMI
jgi:O-antigen/teichoic acid export membrane protein